MKPLIVANWKMNPQSLSEAISLFNSIREGIKKHSNILKNVGIIVCPPFVYLSQLAKIKSKIKLGAQDLFWEEKGTFTGEISPQMLKDLKCEYVIVGHSERRKLGETDEMIHKKLKAAIQAKLKPILCIGETEEERKIGRTFMILKNQLKEDFKNISNIKHRTSNIIIAYEPVWAIGSGNPCQPYDAKKVLLFLRKFIKKNKILYGGSVNSQNALDYIKKANFDGLLVGGASLKVKEFLAILKNCSQT